MNENSSVMWGQDAKWCFVFVPSYVSYCCTDSILNPGNFVTKAKQIDSQSNLISMLNFIGPSYLIIRSSVYTILILDPRIFNVYNLCQTGSTYIRRKAHQFTVRFNEQITGIHLLLLKRAAKTLHRMLPCTSVSVSAKITWMRRFACIITTSFGIQREVSWKS